MSGKLSTHVLDLTTGQPAAGMGVELRYEGALVKSGSTNRDGRLSLLEPGQLLPGEYELTFSVGSYFQQSTFLDRVPIRFRIFDSDQGYHVPLLCTPWSYSTYRGS